MAKRAVVTGGAGFIGSHIAEAYLAEGYEVTVIDDLSSGRIENVPDAARFVESDIGAPKVREMLQRERFDVLNHHAAQMDVRVSVEDPAFDARTNIMGLINLLEGARTGATRRVIFASSGGVVYGESDDLPHPEEARKLPVSPYGVSKLASEFYLAAYAQLYGMQNVSLRYANVYGPRQNPHGEAGVVAIFCSRMRDGGEITIFGDGEQTRDYVNVFDVARANMAATRWTPPAIDDIDAVAFNIGTGIETSVNGLAAALLASTGVTVPIRHAPARPGELQRSAVHIGKAGRDLGWTPEVVLEQGLKATFEWIAENEA